MLQVNSTPNDNIDRQYLWLTVDTIITSVPSGASDQYSLTGTLAIHIFSCNRGSIGRIG